MTEKVVSLFGSTEPIPSRTKREGDFPFVPCYDLLRRGIVASTNLSFYPYVYDGVDPTQSGLPWSEVSQTSEIFTQLLDLLEGLRDNDKRFKKRGGQVEIALKRIRTLRDITAQLIVVMGPHMSARHEAIKQEVMTGSDEGAQELEGLRYRCASTLTETFFETLMLFEDVDADQP